MIDIKIGFPQEYASEAFCHAACYDVKRKAICLDFYGIFPTETSAERLWDSVKGKYVKLTFWQYLYHLLNHETLHYVIEKLEGSVASLLLDNIPAEWTDLELTARDSE